MPFDIAFLLKGSGNLSVLEQKSFPSLLSKNLTPFFMKPPHYESSYTTLNETDAFKERMLDLMSAQQAQIDQLLNIVDEHDSIIRNLRS